MPGAPRLSASSRSALVWVSSSTRRSSAATCTPDAFEGRSLCLYGACVRVTRTRRPGLRGHWGCPSPGQRPGPTQGPESFETHSPVRNLCCSLLSGTTLSLPCRTRGESANSLLAFTSASVTGLPSGFPALIFTCGFLGSAASTETTLAVPTALL